MANAEDLEVVPAAPVSGQDFSNLVASMSRFLRGLARTQLFSAGGIGLPEWVALSILAQKPSANSKVLGRYMGVGGSRINELVGSLVASNLVEIDQNAAGGPGEVRITEAGKAEVEALNSRLGVLLRTTLEGRERTVAIAFKQMKVLGRILHVDSPEGASRKGKTAERHATEE